MNGTVAPPSSNCTAAVTWLSRTPSSAAIRPLTGAEPLTGPDPLTGPEASPEAPPCAGASGDAGWPLGAGPAASGAPAPGAGVGRDASTGSSTGIVTVKFRFLAG